jgi:hypothetical protein
MMRVRGNNEPGMFSICRKEEDFNHVLRCEGMRFWTRSLGILKYKWVLQGQQYARI